LGTAGSTLSLQRGCRPVLIAHVFKSRLSQENRGFGAAPAHLAVATFRRPDETRKPAGQIAEGNQLRAGNPADLNYSCGSRTSSRTSCRRVLLRFHSTGSISTIFSPGLVARPRRAVAANAAELLVIDQLRHGGMIAADGGTRVAPQFQFAKRMARAFVKQ